MNKESDEHPDLIWEPKDTKKAKYVAGFGFLFIAGWIIFLLITLAPSCPSKSPQYYFEYGKKYMTQNDFIKAQRYFTKAIQTSPRYFDAYLERAKAWEKIDSIKNAIKDYDTLLSFKELTVAKTAILYFSRANMHYLLSEDTLACYDWRKACDLNHNKACDVIRKRCR